MNYDTSSFLKDLNELGLELSDQQVKQFLMYYEMLIEKNKVMNLTAITEFDEVMKKHFVDSLSLCKVKNLYQPLSVLDLGTGAGFPGIPLAIAFPELRLTLMDSLNKRILFLNDVVSELDLSNVSCIHARAEEGARQKDYRENFDLCLSRAVANISTLSEYCLPFVKVGGEFISYKSGNIDEELEGKDQAFAILGGKQKSLVRFDLPNSDLSRSFVIIEKEKSTPKKYPRKAGTPAKEPL